MFGGARVAFSLLFILTSVSSECADNDFTNKDGESSDEANLLQSRFSIGEEASIEWREIINVGTIVPRLLEQNKKCTNQVDFRTVGAWRYGQNETGGGDLARCALLVHEVGASFGCMSGNFHFAIDSGTDGLSGCGCATTDHCASQSPTSGWNVYTLTSYTELPDGQKVGVDENKATYFPMAPENVPKIWNTKSTDSFRVSETSDCGEGYEPIMDVDECRRAGNSLNIEPWSFQWLPLFNAFCTFAWWFPPAFFKLGDIEFFVPVFDPGCLVAPGRDRGKKLAFFDRDVLLFNKANAAQLHNDATFVKHRICKLNVEPACAKGTIDTIDTCPPGTSTIRSESACMEAIAKLGLTPNGVFTNEHHYPAGCIYQLPDFAYFNDLPLEKKGTALSANIGPICA